MSSREESLAIPQRLREAVYERDLGFCRVCGKCLGERAALHHIHYGGNYTGMGGRRLHTLDNIVTLCWLPGDPVYGATPCHSRVHSNKGLWVPVLETVVQTPGVTGLALLRASAPREADRSRTSSTASRDSRLPQGTSRPSRRPPGASP